MNPAYPFLISRTFGRRPSDDGIVRWHNEPAFYMAVRGEKDFMIQNARVTVKEGDGLFLNVHTMYKGMPSDSDLICVRFHPLMIAYDAFIERQYVLPITANAEIPYLLLDHHVLWHNDILDYIQHAYMFQASQADDLPLLAGHCFFALWHLLYANLPHAEVRPQESTKITLVRNMLSFIQDNFRNDLTLGEIAASAGIAASTASALFQETVQDSPYHYLQTYRLERAKYLLFKTDDAITEIALDCGFADAAYFSRLFRKECGLTPRQYRRQAREPWHM